MEDALDPAEMIQSQVLKVELVERLSERPGDAMEELARSVANADDAHVRMIDEGLRDHSGRVGDVDQPGVGRVTIDQPRVIERHRYGSERHGKASRAGGLLAGETMLNRDALVVSASGHSADANTAQHERSALDGVFEGSRRCDANAAIADDQLAELGHQGGAA